MRSVVLLAALTLGCGKKVENKPAPAPSASVDPFDPSIECRNYAAKAKAPLEAALREANNNDAGDAKSLHERAAAMGKARGALGAEPSMPAANAHYKRAFTALDGLASGLSTLAAAREPNAPANPEIPLIAAKILQRRKDLDDVVKDLPALCTK